MFDQMTFPSFHNATGSQELQAGAAPFALPESPTIRPSGQDHALVSLSRLPGNEVDSTTTGISGPPGSDSSSPVNPSESTASKSRVLTQSDGYRAKLITCKVCAIEKSCEDFRTYGSRRKFRTTCKDCQNQQERLRKIRLDTRTAEQRKNWRHNNRASALVSSARVRARDKGLTFDLDVTQIQYRIDLCRCELTGIKFDLEGGWNSPSLDRINPDLGYTMDNVRIVLTALNVMMNRWGPDKVIEIADSMRRLTETKARSASLQKSLDANLKALTHGRGSTLFNLTWKELAMQSGQSLSRLAASVPRTSVNGFGSWPTPRAAEAGPDFAIADRPNSGGMSLQTTAALSHWPTPNATIIDAKSTPPIMQHRKPTDPQIGLADVAVHLSHWPTATSTDALRCPSPDFTTPNVTLNHAATLAGWQTPTATDVQRASEGAHTKRQEFRASIGRTSLAPGNLGEQVALMTGWVTPSARDWKDTPGMSTERPDGRSRLDQLPRQAGLAGWATPTANQPGGTPEAHIQRKLNMGRDHATITDLGMQVQAWTPGPARYTASGEMLTGYSVGMESGGQLNPALSRWLQGYPKAWDVTAPAKLARTEPSKTPKAKASAKRRGESVC